MTLVEDDLAELGGHQTLLIIDRGILPLPFWSQLQEKGVDVICRLKAGAAYTVTIFTQSGWSQRSANSLRGKRKGATAVTSTSKNLAQFGTAT